MIVIDFFVLFPSRSLRQLTKIYALNRDHDITKVGLERSYHHCRTYCTVDLYRVSTRGESLDGGGQSPFFIQHQCVPSCFVLFCCVFQRRICPYLHTVGGLGNECIGAMHTVHRRRHQQFGIIKCFGQNFSTKTLANLCITDGVCGCLSLHHQILRLGLKVLYGIVTH